MSALQLGQGNRSCLRFLFGGCESAITPAFASNSGCHPNIVLANRKERISDFNSASQPFAPILASNRKGIMQKKRAHLSASENVRRVSRFHVSSTVAVTMQLRELNSSKMAFIRWASK